MIVYIVLLQLTVVVISGGNDIPNRNVTYYSDAPNERIDRNSTSGQEGDYTELTSAEYFSNEITSDSNLLTSSDLYQDDEMADGSASHVFLPNVDSDLSSDKSVEKELNAIPSQPQHSADNSQNGIVHNKPSLQFETTSSSDINPSLRNAIFTNTSHELNTKVKREESDPFVALNISSINELEMPRQDAGRKPDQTSLVIVFDATGSMKNCLTQLRSGAKLIIDKFAHSDANPIYNYVFVPFRDPGRKK